MKICKGCGKEKDHTEFYTKNPRCKTCGRKSYIAKKYGMSTDDYDNLLVVQDNKCQICKRNIAEINKHLDIDHCHKTGKIRGLLCSNCNVLISRCGDSIEILKQAIVYLEKYHDQ